MADLPKLQADLERLNAEAEELAAEEPGTDLVQVGGKAEDARKALRVQKLRLEDKRQEVERAAEKVQNELDRMKNEAQALIGPLEEKMRALQEGVWTIDLYLGGPEKLVRIADGEPAPGGTPVTVRQLVLYADEEAAVDIDDEEDYGEQSGRKQGLDFRKLHVFDEWLVSDPEHLERVLPEPKGVVAIQPRRDRGRGRDDYADDPNEEENARTYFLIRNGAKVYRTTTKFDVGDTLIPVAEEFTKLFEKTDHSFGDEPDTTRILKPGSWEWEEAQEALEARHRHYFRAALILQGLVDRTPIFHPLPPSGLSFLDQKDHEAGKVRFITDAENIIGTGLEPFRDWQRRLNAQLKKGMRVILSHGLHGCGHSLNQSYSGYWYNPRLYPTTDTEEPETGRVYVIEDEAAGSYIIRYPRTKEIYDARMWIPADDKPGYGWRGGYRTPKQRASARLQPEDKFLLPYDLITVEECEAYLRSREQRPEYMDMVPVLKSAIRAKQREREMEEPFRVMLAGVLARENGGTVAAAEGRVPELVEWYKLANRYHRPLLLEEPPEPVYERLTRGGRKTAASLGLRPSQPQMAPEQAERMRKKASEAAQKAVRLIVQEDARNLKARSRPVNDAVVEKLSGLYEEDTLAVGRMRNGRYLVLVAHEPGSPYVQEVEYDARGKDVLEVRPWRLLATNRIARWQLLWQSEAWRRWPVNESARDHLTGPEKEALLERVMKTAAGYAYGDEEEDGWSVRERKDKGKVIAVIWNAEKGHYETWLHPDAATKKRQRQWQSSRRDEYNDADHTAWRWYRAGDEIKLRETHYGGTPAWRGDTPPWRYKEDDEALVYVDRDLEGKVIRRKRDRERKSERKRERHDEASRLISWVDKAWAEAQWEERRQDFIRETDAPDLWDAERKMLEGSRRTGWKPEGVETDADSWLWKFAVLLRDADETLERLDGRSIKDVADAYGVDWEGVDTRMLALHWPDSRPACDRCEKRFEHGQEGDLLKRDWKEPGDRYTTYGGRVCAECAAELDGEDPDVEDEGDVDPDVLEADFEEDHDTMALPAGKEEE